MQGLLLQALARGRPGSGPSCLWGSWSWVGLGLAQLVLGTVASFSLGDSVEESKTGEAAGRELHYTCFGIAGKMGLRGNEGRFDHDVCPRGGGDIYSQSDFCDSLGLLLETGVLVIKTHFDLHDTNWRWLRQISAPTVGDFISSVTDITPFG